MALADFARCTLDVDAESLTREVRSDTPIFLRTQEERRCPARDACKLCGAWMHGREVKGALPSGAGDSPVPQIGG